MTPPYWTKPQGTEWAGELVGETLAILGTPTTPSEGPAVWAPLEQYPSQSRELLGYALLSSAGYAKKTSVYEHPDFPKKFIWADQGRERPCI